MDAQVFNIFAPLDRSSSDDQEEAKGDQVLVHHLGTKKFVDLNVPLSKIFNNRSLNTPSFKTRFSIAASLLLLLQAMAALPFRLEARVVPNDAITLIDMPDLTARRQCGKSASSSCTFPNSVSHQT